MSWWLTTAVTLLLYHTKAETLNCRDTCACVSNECSNDILQCVPAQSNSTCEIICNTGACTNTTMYSQEYLSLICTDGGCNDSAIHIESSADLFFNGVTGKGVTIYANQSAFDRNITRNLSFGRLDYSCDMAQLI